jgi:hypothetical protein
METQRVAWSIEPAEESNPESAIAEGATGIVALGMVAVAAVAFFAAMVMAMFSGATVANPAHDRARLSMAVAAGVVLALAGVIVGIVRSRRDAGGIGRVERRRRQRKIE